MVRMMSRLKYSCKLAKLSVNVYNDISVISNISIFMKSRRRVECTIGRDTKKAQLLYNH